jgi:N-acetylglutamate synthase-like GNAT family acetyltransferase
LAEFVLRKAAESDSRQIRELIDLVGINPTGLDWRRFLVAVDPGGRVIGCGQVKPHGREIRELASIAVRPEFRGRGIARAVIEKLLAENTLPIYLMCMSHNGPLYEKFGFKSLAPGAMPRYYQRIHRLFRLAGAIHKAGEELLVMKLG